MNRFVRASMIFNLYLNTNHQCSWGTAIHSDILFCIPFIQLRWYVRVMTGLEILEVYFNQMLIIKWFGQSDISFLLSYSIISKHRELFIVHSDSVCCFVMSLPTAASRSTMASVRELTTVCFLEYNVNLLHEPWSTGLCWSRSMKFRI